MQPTSRFRSVVGSGLPPVPLGELRPAGNGRQRASYASYIGELISIPTLIAADLSLVFRVMLRDPALDQPSVLSGFLQQFGRLGVGGHFGGVVIDHVSLASARLEIIGELPSWGA